MDLLKKFEQDRFKINKQAATSRMRFTLDCRRIENGLYKDCISGLMIKNTGNNFPKMWVVYRDKDTVIYQDSSMKNCKDWIREYNKNNKS
jgi:hypothetical protein